MHQDKYKIIINLRDEKIHPDNINLTRERRLLAEAIKVWSKCTDGSCSEWFTTKTDFSIIYRHLTGETYVEPCIKILCYKMDKNVSTKDFRDSLICLLKDIKQSFSISTVITIEEFFTNVIEI